MPYARLKRVREEKSKEFFSAGFAVSAFNVICSQAVKPSRDNA